MYSSGPLPHEPIFRKNFPWRSNTNIPVEFKMIISLVFVIKIFFMYVMNDSGVASRFTIAIESIYSLKSSTTIACSKGVIVYGDDVTLGGVDLHP